MTEKFSSQRKSFQAHVHVFIKKKLRYSWNVKIADSAHLG